MSSILEGLGGQNWGNRNLGPLPAGVSLLGWIEEAIGWPTLVAPRADVVAGATRRPALRPVRKGEMGVILLKKLSSGRPTSSVRPPRLLRFDPPADPSAWHMTGRFNWPCPHYGIVPNCEWANDEGMRIWLPAQHKDLAAEFTYRAEGRWRELVMRSRRLLARVVRRPRAPVFCTTLFYLQLAADVGI